jgi:hypothetical protein
MHIYIYSIYIYINAFIVTCIILYCTGMVDIKDLRPAFLRLMPAFKHETDRLPAIRASLQVCIYMYMYVCVYIYIHIYMLTGYRPYGLLFRYMDMCVYVYVHVCVCIYLYTYICWPGTSHTGFSSGIYICVCMYMYMYVCVYIYIHIYMLTGYRPYGLLFSYIYMCM